MAINGKTSEEYYDSRNSENYGDYAFVGIEQLVNSFMGSYSGDDTLLGHIPRHKAVKKIKEQVRELTFTTLNQPKVVELDLGDALDIIKPQDYVDYIRISYVDKTNGRIMPMAENRHTPLGVAYLQDQDANLLFDDQGDVLIGTTILEQESDKQNTSILEGVNVNGNCIHEYFIDRPLYNMDTTMNANGTFSQNENRIHFGSDAATKTILLEYISDGLNVPEASIKVHKFAEQALYASVHYELAKASIKVPNYEKANIKKERDALVRNAKVRLLGIKPQEFIQQLKAFNKWIR